MQPIRSKQATGKSPKLQPLVLLLFSLESLGQQAKELVPVPSFLFMLPQLQFLLQFLQDCKAHPLSRQGVARFLQHGPLQLAYRPNRLDVLRFFLRWSVILPQSLQAKGRMLEQFQFFGWLLQRGKYFRGLPWKQLILFLRSFIIQSCQAEINVIQWTQFLQSMIQADRRRRWSLPAQLATLTITRCPGEARASLISSIVAIFQSNPMRSPRTQPYQFPSWERPVPLAEH